MTELERVRDWLEEFEGGSRIPVGSPSHLPPGYSAYARDVALPIIDAHLKEDAEIRRGYRTREVEANTRRNEAEAELTRLREDIKYLQQMLMQDTIPEEYVKTHDEQRREIARLREALKRILQVWDADLEYRGRFDTFEDALDIARNALKETND